jgi:hypothetical protein
MDTCSYFIKDKALFGSYPSDVSVKELEDNGVRYFVNLTYDDEDKIKQYHTNYQIITYNIKDRSVPHDLLTFTQFISQLADIIKQLKISEKIYIHCKGGHGRSGLVVACLICYIFKLSPYEALNYTSKCHSNRSVMRDKWRKIGAPQTHLQKKFVHQLFRPINYARMFKGHFALDDNYTSNMPLREYYQNKIDSHTDMKEFLLHTYMKPIVSYDNSPLSKEICEILTDIRQTLYYNPI